MSSLLQALDEAKMAKRDIKAVDCDTATAESSTAPDTEVVEEMKYLSLAASSSDLYDTGGLEPPAGESCEYCQYTFQPT